MVFTDFRQLATEMSLGITLDFAIHFAADFAIYFGVDLLRILP